MGLKFPDPGVPGRGFYINPSRRGPAVPRGSEKRGFRASPTGEGFPGLLGRPQTVSRDLPGPRAPGPPPGNRGGPARGVDVKPPSARRPGTPGPVLTGLPGPSPRGEASRTCPEEVPGTGVPDPGSRRPREGPSRPLGGPGPPGQGLFYINPSRRGPAVPAGSGPCPGGTRGRRPAP